MERLNITHSTLPKFHPPESGYPLTNCEEYRAQKISKNDVPATPAQPGETAMRPVTLFRAGREAKKSPVREKLRKFAGSVATVAVLATGMTVMTEAVEIGQPTAQASAFDCNRPIQSDSPTLKRMFKDQCDKKGSAGAETQSQTPSTTVQSPATVSSDDKVIMNRWCSPKGGVDQKPTQGNPAQLAEWARADQLCGSGSQASASVPPETTSTEPYVPSPPLTTTTVPLTPYTMDTTPPPKPRKIQKSWQKKLDGWEKDLRGCFGKELEIGAISAGNQCARPVANMTDAVLGLTPGGHVFNFLGNTAVRYFPFAGILPDQWAATESLFHTRQKLRDACNCIYTKKDPTFGVSDSVIVIDSFWTYVQNEVYKQHGEN